MRTTFLRILAIAAAVALWTAASPAMAGQDIPQHLQIKVKKVCQLANQPVSSVNSNALLAMLDSPDSRVRYVAVYTLGDIRESRAVEPLLGLLINPDPNLRRMAAHALGKIGDEQALLPLAYVLNTIDEQPLVRCEATKALSRIPSGEATRLLMAAHCGDCPVVQRTLIIAQRTRVLAGNGID